MIRVRVIAASPALRAGLASMLATDAGILVVGEGTASGGNSASAERIPDVVLVATAPPKASVPERPGEGLPVAPTLYLSNEATDVRSLLSGGTSWGLLPLDASASELQAAVRALVLGLSVVSPTLVSDGAGAVTESGPLTDRETEVLGLLSKGLANKQIAAALGISEHTVKFHISSIYTKLDATSRTQAVREGLRNGWIVL